MLFEKDIPAFAAAPNVPRQLVAIPLRQPDVHEGHIRTPLRQEGEGSLDVSRLLHLVPPRAQHGAKHVAGIVVVLDDEDSRLWAE